MAHKARPVGAPRLADSPGYERWKAFRAEYLNRQPYCVFCARFGLRTLATELDHIVPRRIRPDLWYDPANLQGLCARCHNSHKEMDETRGYSDATGPDGWPADPRNPRNAR